MEVDLSTPRVIHALRFSPQSARITARAEVAKTKVFSDDLTKSRQTMSDLARQTGALAAINGDFFPWTGDPIGLMVRNGELVSGPWPKRAAFAWGKNGSAGGIGTISIGARNGSLGTFKIDGLNEECPPGKVVLNTEAAGYARSKGLATHVVLKGSGRFGPNTTWEGSVERVVQGEIVAVPEGGAVITSNARGDSLGSLREGDPIRFELNANGFDWTKFDQAIGGGPFLLKNGQVAIDWDYQGFGASFANRRHPRTAVGRTRSGEIWFVTIDGRQALSAGATLEETARIMKRYGCVEAVNLDGGGSTTFHLLGMTLNRPSDGREREVANGVLFFGEPSRHAGPTIKIKAPAKLFLGQAERLSVFNAAGASVSPAGVVWQAQGTGWIDQGGLLRPTTVGSIRIQAWSEGRLATIDVPVVEKPKPVVKKPPAKTKRPVRKTRKR